MKSFDDFTKFCSDYLPELTYEIAHSLKDVTDNQRTISKEEWQFIQEFILSSNMALLRWYHQYFFEDSEKLPEDIQ